MLNTLSAECLPDHLYFMEVSGARIEFLARRSKRGDNGKNVGCEIYLSLSNRDEQETQAPKIWPEKTPKEKRERERASGVA